MMRAPGPGWGGRASLAAATALLVAGLMAVPAYVSSTATATLQADLNTSCASDLGITLDSNGSDQAAEIETRANELGGLATSAEVLGSHRIVVPDAESDDAGVFRPVVLLWRPDIEQLVDVTPGTLTDGSVLVPAWSTADGAYATGATLIIGRPGPDGDPTDATALAVAGSYPDIATRPEPPEWCSYDDLLRPNERGDRPPPVLLTTAATITQQPPLTWSHEVRVYPDVEGLRIDEAETISAELTLWQDEVWEQEGLPESRKPPVLLATSIARARQVADYVRLTTDPLRYASALAAMVLLVAAAMLAGRAQLLELRLRVVRGAGFTRLAGAQLAWLMPVTCVGTTAGWLMGWAAVRLLGPSSAIEPSAITSGSYRAFVGWLAATLVAAVVIAALGLATVDQRRRSHAIRAGGLVVIALVALAVWSFVRLDELGGVRQVGVEVRGGDQLAQAFPLLGALAATAALAGPLVWLLARWRRHGGRLSPAVLIGSRRVMFEPVITVTLMMATALAVAIAFQASSLTRSVDRLLTDKASTYVGADLVIRALDPVDDLTGLGAASTIVYATTTDDRATRVLGIDPATFVDTAWFRSDGLPIPIGDAIRAIADEPQSAAVVIDPDLEFESSNSASGRTATVPLNGLDHDLDVVARGSFFPGYEHGRPMIIVNASVLDGGGSREVWVRDPVDDAVTRLANRGVRVRSSLAPQDVFATTNYLSARWAYAALTAFAVVVGVVTLLGQLLVVESRSRQRRVGRVVTAPMGFGRRHETIASAIEVGVPLLGGGVVGAAIGWLTSRVAISRLDSLRDRQPPARLVVDTTTLLITACVLIAATTLLAVWSTWRSGRGDAMEAMRVAED